MLRSRHSGWFCLQIGQVTSPLVTLLLLLYSDILSHAPDPPLKLFCTFRAQAVIIKEIIGWVLYEWQAYSIRYAVGNRPGAILALMDFVIRRGGTGSCNHRLDFSSLKNERVLWENNGWEACRKDEGGLCEEGPFSGYLKNEQGPGMRRERKQAHWSWGQGNRREEGRTGGRCHITHSLLGYKGEPEFCSKYSEKTLKCCRQKNNRFWFAF